MVGAIENSQLLGGWLLRLRKADRLPQDLASGFGIALNEKLGVKYTPVYWIAEQIVNGKNYKLAARRDKQVSGGVVVTNYVIVTIHIPAGSVGGKGAKLISEESAVDFVLRDDIEKGVKKALTEFTGSGNEPLIELGSQVVKGVNYHFICESKRVVLNAEPYLTRVVINNFQDDWHIVEIEQLS